MFRRMTRFMMCLFALLLVTLLLVGGFWGLKGYQMYRNVIGEKTLEERIAAISEDAHFVSFEELPKIYVQAVVSVEDKRFWKHHGIDIWAISRALFNDLRAMSFVQGGSTITQQLVKNICFSQEKTLQRKFAEIFAARDMEMNFCY